MSLSRIGEALAFLFKISRPRFWIYIAGTFVVGFAIGMDSWIEFFRPEYLIYLVYFFVPANILVYGVNDYWDEETDRLNPKKDGIREQRLEAGKRRLLAVSLLVVGGISIALLATQDWWQRAIFAGFILLAYFYSAPPLRFKRLPILDFASNILYVMPGIFGYFLVAGVLPPAPMILAGFSHTSAMHIFSAIPDICYDKATGITTTPVVIGRKASLLLCLVFWSVLSGLVIWLSGFHPLAYLVLLYPAIPLALLLKSSLSVERLYWYLPYLNWGLGGLLFIMVVSSKI